MGQGQEQARGGVLRVKELWMEGWVEVVELVGVVGSAAGAVWALYKKRMEEHVTLLQGLWTDEGDVNRPRWTSLQIERQGVELVGRLTLSDDESGYAIFVRPTVLGGMVKGVRFYAGGAGEESLGLASIRLVRGGAALEWSCKRLNDDGWIPEKTMLQRY